VSIPLGDFNICVILLFVILQEIAIYVAHVDDLNVRTYRSKVKAGNFDWTNEGRSFYAGKLPIQGVDQPIC
jgi:hypothetical protein